MKIRNDNMNKGITLIALVITIVVLLILAGVSIATLTGDNGLLSKAQEAKEQTEVAEVKDRAQLDILDWQADQLKDNNDATLNDDIVKGILNGKDYISGFNEEDLENIKVITENGYEFPISDLYDKEDKAGGDDVKVGEDFTDSNGNEWVWIEVPKTEEVYKTAGVEITDFTDKYDIIYNDLASYAGTYRDEENKGGAAGIDEWYDGSGNNASNSSNLNDTSGCGLTNEEYIELKKKMLKSVYENGGFHIGKYEVGIEEENTYRTDEANPIAQTPVIQQNKIVYNYVTTAQAQELSEGLKEGLNLEDKEISLMFGIQWDLVLKYIETQSEYTKDGTNTLIDQTLIKSKSTKWGNYYDATFTVTNTNAKYSENDGESYEPVPAEGYQKPSPGGLLTTGATERNSVAGIYDIAGNVSEWTLEKTTLSGIPCSDRGGYYSDGGSFYPASVRIYSTTSGSNDYRGFRPALY